MDRIEAMRLFARIVERGSFAQAARDLQMPRPTVTRAIKELEALLGTRLLERTTRQVSLTLDGNAYYERCIRLLADLDEAESAFRSPKPHGPLRVDLQGTVARHFVMPALPAFIERYPDINLRLGEGERMVDLIQEGIDCVVRAGELGDSSLVGRRVASFEQVTCASPAYLKRYGIPRSLDDLQNHRMVAYVASASGQPYPLEFLDGKERRPAPLPSVLNVSGAEIYAASGVAGLGLIQVPRYRVEHQLNADLLRIVLPHLPPPPMPVSVLYLHNRQLSPRVRVFIDWVSEVLSAAALPQRAA
jgi:DNA-binding transcriptional LysR family regulator